MPQVAVTTGCCLLRTDWLLPRRRCPTFPHAIWVTCLLDLLCARGPSFSQLALPRRVPQFVKRMGVRSFQLTPGCTLAVARQRALAELTVAGDESKQ